MSEKCICNINGYSLKDKIAREEIEKLKNGESGGSGSTYLHKVVVEVCESFEGENYTIYGFIMAVKNNIKENLNSFETLQEKIAFFNQHYTYEIAFTNHLSPEGFDIGSEPVYITSVSDSEDGTEYSGEVVLIPLNDNYTDQYAHGNFLRIYEV